MTQPTPPTTPPTEDNEVSATWLREQFGSFGTRLQKLEEGLAGLPNLLKPQQSESPPTQQQPQQTPPTAQVTQPAESTPKPSGARSVLRIGTGLRVRK